VRTRAVRRIGRIADADGEAARRARYRDVPSQSRSLRQFSKPASRGLLPFSAAEEAVEREMNPLPQTRRIDRRSIRTAKPPAGVKCEFARPGARLNDRRRGAGRRSG
jgi:hypothetical protein